MLKLTLFICLTYSIFGDPTQRELKSIKGVPTSRFALYQSSGANGENFRCFDGSRTILYSQLNDDYCDCPDGSDEPGTSACSNAQFYCSNVGHKGNFIPSSRVNDKLCDCCDGSDEYSSGISCPNICAELGRAAKMEKERVSSIARKGFLKRQELAKEGQSMKAEKLKDIEPLKAEKESLQPKLQSLEAAKKTAEEAERKLKDEHEKKWQEVQNEKKKIKAAEWFNDVDVNQDGKITADEMKLLPYIDDDKNSEITDEEVQKYSTQDNIDVEYFNQHVYEKLKVAKKMYDRELKEKSERREENGNVENDSDDLLAEEDRNEESDEDNEEDDSKMPEYPPEVQDASNVAREARRQYDEVNNNVLEIDAKIREAEEFSSSDFGEEMEWASMKGKCFERNVQQYTYTFCPFGSNTQKDVGAHGGTNLGRFKNWSGADGKKYSKQKYEDGDRCWNGPNRSTDVEIECGEEHELVEVTEPAKCEYQFVFRTPLACNDPDHDANHEEL